MNISPNFLYCIRSAWRILLALVFSLSLAGISAQEARAFSYMVTTTSDIGAGSLRAVITAANSHLGADTIIFNVSGTIALSSALPAISEDLTIDGSGQNIKISGMNSYRVLTVNYGAVLTISDLHIAEGRYETGNGAGIYNAGASIVRDVTFSYNQAGFTGGAIYNHYGTVVVLNSTFYENGLSAPSGSGAAIYTNHGILTVANSSFAYNVADYGGGIYNYQGTLRVTNSTFSVNVADMNGGAIYSQAGTLHLKNNILANSLSAEDCYSDAALSSDIHNLIEVNRGCGTPISSADPKLGSLEDNGGPTMTMALLPGSPAFDAGDDPACAAEPVSNLDQRGITRPRGAHCDIGSYELDKGKMIFRSVGTRDGWVLESSEDSSTGGTINAIATTFNLGDNGVNKQYRAILSFNTATLPNTAVVTKVTLKIKKQGLLGTDPFTILGGLKADIRQPYFGTSVALAAGDFQAAVDRAAVGTFGTTPVSNWYSAVLLATGYPYINLTGTTQFRLRFLTDDNNDDGADYMKFFSGNYGTATSRPTLVIEYDIL